MSSYGKYILCLLPNYYIVCEYSKIKWKAFFIILPYLNILLIKLNRYE